MATKAIGARTRLGDDWSPARWYLVISGVGLILLGGVGFALNRSFPTSSDAVGDSAFFLGFLETNGWHNTAGVASGLLALGFALRASWARFGALFKGVFYVVVTTALVVVEPSTFLLVSNIPDQVVHGSLAVGGIATGLLTPRTYSALSKS